MAAIAWRLRLVSARGRIRRRHALRHGLCDWVACVGRPLTVRECSQFRWELREVAEPVRRLHSERAEWRSSQWNRDAGGGVVT